MGCSWRKPVDCFPACAGLQDRHPGRGEVNPALDSNNAMAEKVLTVLEPLFHILRNR